MWLEECVENRFYLKKKKTKNVEGHNTQEEKDKYFVGKYLLKRNKGFITRLLVLSIKYRKVQDLLSKRSRMKKNGKGFL